MTIQPKVVRGLTHCCKVRIVATLGINLKFPAIKKMTDPYFAKRQCRVCESGGMHEPNSFAILHGGATDMSTSAASAPAWLGLTWHGAHTDQGGEGKLPDTGAELSIVEDCPGGQYAIYFCSTECLRSFLNQAVDALEESVS